MRRQFATELQTTRIGENNRAQVVTIPLHFRFPDRMKKHFGRVKGLKVQNWLN